MSAGRHMSHRQATDQKEREKTMPTKKAGKKGKPKVSPKPLKAAKGKVSSYFKRIDSKANIEVGTPEQYLEGPAVDQDEYVQLLAGVSRAVVHVAIE